MAPLHVFVLAATALAGIGLVLRATAIVPEDGTASADQVATLAFAATFNAVVACGLGIAWLADLLFTTVAAARRRQWGRGLTRLCVASLPLAIFAAGHLALNPWALPLLREARRALY